MARIAGLAVIVAFFVGLFVATANKQGLASAAVSLGMAIGVTGAVMWAVCAILRDEWWPFRDL